MHLIMDLKRFSERRTPFYTYDTQLLQQTLTAIRDAIADAPHFHVHYAVKACATPGILPHRSCRPRRRLRKRGRS